MNINSRDANLINQNNKGVNANLPIDPTNLEDKYSQMMPGSP